MSVDNAFNWRGPSLFTTDKKLKQMANGIRGGQIASQLARDKLDEKKQVFVYSKGRLDNAKTEK